MKKKILVVVANYYQQISAQLLTDTKKILKLRKINPKIVYVPGVFEIPIIVSKLQSKFDGFIVLGCVIKGETPHFDLICSSTFNAILSLSINFNKPICNGIITALNLNQAHQRSKNKLSSNKPNKGSEAAKALISIFKNGTKKI